MRPSRLLSVRSFLFVSLVIMLVGYTGLVFGIWLPWATEEDKVKKTIDDVWQALIDNNQIFLKNNVTGTGVKFFIDQEREQIKELKIKGYKCRIKKIKIDNIKNVFAFAEYDRLATLEDGGNMAIGTVSVLKKVDGVWKLFTGYKTKVKKSREDGKNTDETTDLDQE